MTTEIMLSPLLLQEGEVAGVPTKIKELLRRDFLEKNKEEPVSLSGEPEKVLYYGPPTDTAVKDPYFLPIMSIGIGNLIMGISLAIVLSFEPFVSVICAFFSIPMVLLPVIWAYYYAVRDRYGFYVVTNYRAAIIVPERHYGIYGQSVSSYFFKKYFDDIVYKGNKSGLCNMMQRSANSPAVDFRFGDVLTFYNPPRQQDLENAIISVTQQLLETKQAQSLQFEVKTNDVHAQMSHFRALFGIFIPIVFVLGVFAAWIAVIYAGVTGGRWHELLYAMILTSGLFTCPLIWQGGKKAQEDFEAASQGRSFDFCKRTDLIPDHEQKGVGTKTRKTEKPEQEVMIV